MNLKMENKTLCKDAKKHKEKVGKCFGVSQFKIHAICELMIYCMILYNMIIEDERNQNV
jgi:hypothetical protein